MAQILPFPKPGAATLTPVSCFVRIGEAHRQLSSLHAAGHLPARHAVVDASRLRHQSEIVGAMREAGTQIVLDTEAAELAAPAKCAGHARRAPWAREDGRPLGPEDFRGEALTKLLAQMAQFAVENGIHTVLAPTHFLGDPTFSDWLTVDRETCVAFRQALDREGGRNIVIDYPVIIPNTMLNDPSARGGLISALEDLPVANVWIRASGFGADAGPLAAKRFLMAVSGLHNLGKPIVADYAGGLVGQAALAFGAVSGIGRGISERERFDAREWHKPPPRDEDGGGGFGRTTRFSIPDLHRSVTLPEMDVLSSARGGKRVCGCGDRSCCQNGYTDMLTEHRGHASRQMFRSIEAIEKVPDLLRESSFLDGQMASAQRKAREVKGLRPSAAEAERHRIDLDDLMKRMTAHSQKIDKLRASLENLHETRGNDAPRARPIKTFNPTDSQTSQTRP